jgi:hypothetical protein
MKKRVLLLTSIMLCVSAFYGLQRKNFRINSSLPTSSIHNIDEASETTSKYYTAFTGEETTKNIINNLPFMAIIENSKDARPQSGISYSDIVYETMAEGGIPRFIAIFQKNSPKVIGPIRSIRPYFIDITKEYNLPFAHCGGSQEALDNILKEGLMSINEMNNGTYFWRDNTRSAPHNLYTSAEKLRTILNLKSYVKTAQFHHSFDKKYWTNPNITSVSSINLKLNKYYSTSYVLKEDKYIKSMDGVVSMDKLSNTPISVNNIIIQITDIKLQSDGQHLDVKLVGNGEGYIISNGKLDKFNWTRKDISSPTILTNKSNEEIPLLPGKTWWHIIDKNAIVEFN